MTTLVPLREVNNCHYEADNRDQETEGCYGDWNDVVAGEDWLRAQLHDAQWRDDER